MPAPTTIMVPFADPDGNVLMIHNRYAPRN